MNTVTHDPAATATLRDHAYPDGTFAGLIDTPFVTAPTRAALKARLAKPPVTEPGFLTGAEFTLLGAVCDRLVDQEGERRVDVAGAIDSYLASGESDGWRYDAMPDDGTAMALAGHGFLDLPAADRDRVISAVQAGDPPGETWRSLPAKRFFEDLLAAVTEAFYAHPLSP